MGLNQNLEYYDSPEITVVEIRSELGFAITDRGVGGSDYGNGRGFDT